MRWSKINLRLFWFFGRLIQLDLGNVTLTYEHFRCLLTELFINGGITREKIVILFFFCSDLTLRAFRCNYIRRLWLMLSWSLRFIFENVCTWVAAKGGWENVLGNFVPKLVFTAAGILTCAALAIYIRKNWWPIGDFIRFFSLNKHTQPVFVYTHLYTNCPFHWTFKVQKSLIMIIRVRFLYADQLNTCLISVSKRNSHYCLKTIVWNTQKYFCL